MSETTSGVRSVLSRPGAYDLLQRALGSLAYRRHIAEELVRARPGDRVLDIGCGPGDLVADLPDTTYVGFDPSAAYIDSAVQRYGERGEFFVGGVDEVAAEDLGTFDRVVAVGVLHHLHDDAARSLWALARDVLAPGGHVVTVDACFHEGQARIARWLAARDRGTAVRPVEEYGHLADEYFDDVAVRLHTDLLRIPYSHAVVVASDPSR